MLTQSLSNFHTHTHAHSHPGSPPRPSRLVAVSFTPVHAPTPALRRGGGVRINTSAKRTQASLSEEDPLAVQRPQSEEDSEAGSRSTNVHPGAQRGQTRPPQLFVCTDCLLELRFNQFVTSLYASFSGYSSQTKLVVNSLEFGWSRRIPSLLVIVDCTEAWV